MFRTWPAICQEKRQERPSNPSTQGLCNLVPRCSTSGAASPAVIQHMQGILGGLPTDATRRLPNQPTNQPQPAQRPQSTYTSMQSDAAMREYHPERL